MNLQLYGHPFSSYTWKALIALYANGTTFEFREIGPSVPKYESFTVKAHPSGQFPVLTDAEAIVVETSSSSSTSRCTILDPPRLELIFALRSASTVAAG